MERPVRRFVIKVKNDSSLGYRDVEEIKNDSGYVLKVQQIGIASVPKEKKE